jgi:hypothetical protein
MPAFPLSIAPNNRHLVDGSGTPFLLNGDTAWSIVVGATREEAELYLDDRAARGFNGMVVNLIEHVFGPDTPRTVYGVEPFTTTGDLTTPNDAYFDHAVWIVEQAAARGILVLLAPAYLGYIDPHWPGYGGAAEGWYDEVLANGQDACERYGRYVGERFAHLSNVLWVMSGDRDPSDALEGMRAMVRGLQAAGPAALFTAHCHPEHRPLEQYPDDPWLTVNQTYSYEIVHRNLIAEYQHEPAMPNFLFESTYEGEHNASELQIRRQAYWALTCGAFGHCLGTYPVWLFGGAWKELLDSPGARHMQHFNNLFAPRRWWELVPDVGHAVVAGGLGEFRGLDMCTTAITPDRRLAIGYLPSARTITVDFGAFASDGPVEVTWFDPITGGATAAGSFEAAGKEQLTPPGDQDWAVVFEQSAATV